MENNKNRLLFVAITLVCYLAVGKSCLNVIRGSDMEKKIYECCNEKLEDGKLAKLKRSFSENEPECIRTLKGQVEKGGTYYSICTKINLTDFSNWCKKLRGINKADITDAFLLSSPTEYLPWDSKIRQTMFDIIYGVKFKNIYKPVRIADVFLSEKKNFWNTFFTKVTDDDSDVLACMQFFNECSDNFIAYFEGKDYLECNKEDVKSVMEPIIKYNSEAKKMIIHKISPKAMEEKNGLLHLMCEDDGPYNTYLSINWSTAVVQSFFYNSIKYFWPFELIKAVLTSNIKKIMKFIPKNKPYMESKDDWNFGKILHLIDYTCIKSDINFINDVYTYTFLDRFPIICANYIYEIVVYSDDIFKLTSKMVKELLSYKYLDKFTERLDIKEKDRPKLPLVIETEMIHIKRFSDKMIETDSQKLGIRSLITFMALFNEIKNIISVSDLDSILKKVKEMPLVTAIDPIEDTNLKNEPLIIGKIDIREKYGYEPDYNYSKKNEKNKNWGKIVFVAIHATCIRYNNGSIQDDDIEKELRDCIDEIISARKRDLYCKLFKTNPYFGEFDKLIEKEYS